MIKKLALVFVIVSLMAAPAVLAFEYVSAFASTSGGDYIGADCWEENDGSQAFVWVHGYINESSFDCHAEGIFGLVDVIASAKHGTLEVDTRELYCYPGSFPYTNILAECIANGKFSDHSTGNSITTYEDGTTVKWHRNAKYERADCTITADSVLFDQYNDDGALEHSDYFEK